MFDLILNLTVTFGGMLIVSYYFYSSTNWSELLKKYKTKKKESDYLFIAKEKAYINQIAFSKLSIGVSSEGLFLSRSFLVGLASSSILIPWNDISYGENVDNSQTENYIFNIGNPKLAILKLSQQTVEHIHKNYGKPIFFERLGEPS